MQRFLQISLFLFLWTTTLCYVAKAQNTTKVLDSKTESTILKLSISNYSFEEVRTPNGTEVIVKSKNATPILEKGSPDLPKFTSSVIIPDLAETQLQILNTEYVDIPNVSVAPSKGNFDRTKNPAQIPYSYGNAYSQNNFFPEKIAELQKPYILRDFRGQTISFFPFQYNPVTKILRIYKTIEVKISTTGKNGGENQFIRNKITTALDADFYTIYKRQFVNFQTFNKYTPLQEQGRMLIISYNSFAPALAPFIEWKRQTGRIIEVVNLSTIGTTATQVKQFITNYYSNHGLTYVLLVGDAQQVPTNSGSGLGGDSDNAYGYITGTDHYQEIFIGRFSAENLQQVETQVQRTINYEKALFSDNSFLKKTLGIASEQGPGDDNEYDWQHIRNIQTDLLGFTYAQPGYELYDGSQGGNDAAGDPTPTMVSTVLNSGTGIITYTGHGSDNSFVTSSFSSTDISNLNNIGKLPLIFSVACVNGNFVGQTCFAETWLRSTKNGQPTGAVATLMSTINQSWNPPMEGQDEMVDILTESYANNIKRTFGGIAMNGCFKMNDTYGADGSEMTDTWTVFGDPSLMIRTDIPTQLNVSHSNVAIIGTGSFAVTCPTQNAQATLTLNNEIIGTTTIVDGGAVINFTPLTNVGMLKLTVVAFNKIPYQTEIQIIAPAGPFLVYKSNTIHDISGNNNNIPEYNETISLDVQIENVGPDAANSITALLSASDSYISIIDSIESYGNIAGNQTATQNLAFSFQIANNIPDGHAIPFTLRMISTDTTWMSNFSISVQAPKLKLGNYVVNDNGNQNGILDAGETADISVAVFNEGHSNIQNLNAIFTSTSQYLTINNATATISSLNAGDSANISFNISAAANTPMGTPANISYSVTNGQYSAEMQTNLVIGIIPEFLMNNTTVNVAVGKFYDSGGANAAHQSNENYTMTFRPLTPNSKLKFNFTEFDVESMSGGSCYDVLKVYDGLNAQATLIGEFCGNSVPAELANLEATNSNGAITFVFSSDGSVNKLGWTADISQILSLNAGIASTQNATICSGTSATIILNGAVGNVQWQSSTTQEGFIDVPNATSVSFVTPNLTDTTYFRAKVFLATDTVFSNIVKISVKPTANIGILTSNYEKICSGNEITLNVANFEGNLTWKRKNNSQFENFSNLSQNSLSLNDSLIGNYEFQVVATVNGCESTSNVISVMFYKNPKGGISTAKDTILCENSNSLVTLFNFEGNIVWQKSDSENGIFENIELSDSSILIFENIAKTNFYRAKLSQDAFGCVESFSSISKINVLSQSFAGNILPSDSAACANGKVVLTSQNSVGNLIWQKAKTQNGLFSTISNATDSIYETTSLTSESFYRVISSQIAKGCKKDTSETIKISIIPSTVAGKASSNFVSLCKDTAVTLTLTGSRGNIQWLQSEFADSGFVNIENATSNVYESAKLTKNIFYKAFISQNGAGCAEIFSNVISIKRNSAPELSKISNDSILKSVYYPTWSLDNFVNDDITAKSRLIWNISGKNVAVSVVNRVARFSLINSNFAGIDTILVSVKDECNAMDADTVLINVIIPASICGDNSQVLEIFPNPSSDIFQIRTDNSLKIKKLVVCDLSGKIIFEQKHFDSDLLKINLKDKPQGIYLLKIETENGVRIEKLVKE